MSWALDEPGQGKQLVTGRLIQSPSFAQVADDTAAQGLGALAALISHGTGDAWGIEVSLSLKSGNVPSTHHHLPQLHHLVSRGMRSSIGSTSDLAALSDAIRPSSPAASSLSYRAPLRPMTTIAAKPAVRSLSPTRRVFSASESKKAPIKRLASAAGRKKKYPDAHNHSTSHAHSTSKVASDAISKSGNASSDSESFPGDIPAQLYSNPESLTKEQAERLLESPAFLSMLSRLTGQPIRPAENSATRKIRLNRKRQAEDHVKKEDEHSAKKVKLGDPASQDINAVAGPSGTTPKTPSKEEGPAALKCFNCGRTKSAVWRTKVMEDGNSVRVCNGECPSAQLTCGKLTKLVSLRTVLEQTASHAPSVNVARSRRNSQDSRTTRTRTISDGQACLKDRCSSSICSVAYLGWRRTQADSVCRCRTGRQTDCAIEDQAKDSERSCTSQSYPCVFPRSTSCRAQKHSKDRRTVESTNAC